MTFGEFLSRVINDGLAEVRRVYSRPTDRHKLEGAIAGLELCRGLNPHGLATALQVVRRDMMSRLLLLGRAGDHYWRMRYREAQVEWVCNVVSALLQEQGNNLARKLRRRCFLAPRL